MSAADIEKGARWSSDIAYQLKETRVGIICLTPENIDAPWVLFEAGALSKKLDRTLVCPYLFDLEPSGITGPLVQFQAARADRDDTKKLLGTINRALTGKSLTEEQLGKAFEKWWPDLEGRFKAIPTIASKRPNRRSEREILEEMLELMRMQVRHGSFRREGDPIAWSHLQQVMESGPRLLSEYKRQKLNPLKISPDPELIRVLTSIEEEASKIEALWHGLISQSETLQRRLDMLDAHGHDDLQRMLMWMTERGTREDLDLLRYLKEAAFASPETERLFEISEREIIKRSAGLA